MRLCNSNCKPTTRSVIDETRRVFNHQIIQLILLHLSFSSRRKIVHVSYSVTLLDHLKFHATHMSRLLSFVRRCSSLKEAQSCQDYLTVCLKSMISLSSRVFRGTFYEFQAKEALERHLNLCNLSRVGGAGDNGIDLLGKWDLKKFKRKKKNASLSKELNLIDRKSEIRVLIQCKNHATKIKASIIRELAGVHEFHVNGNPLKSAFPTFMFLVSPLPLTKQALAQLDTSSVPLIHVRMTSMTREISGLQNDDYLVENWQNYSIGPIYMNHTARNLLQGLSVEDHLCGFQ